MGFTFRMIRKLELLASYGLKEANVAPCQLLDELWWRSRENFIFVWITMLSKPQPQELFVDALRFHALRMPRLICLLYPVAARIWCVHLIDDNDLTIRGF